jgi:hypothetical protein
LQLGTIPLQLGTIPLQLGTIPLQLGTIPLSGICNSMEPVSKQKCKK